MKFFPFIAGIFVVMVWFITGRILLNNKQVSRKAFALILSAIFGLFVATFFVLVTEFTLKNIVVSLIILFSNILFGYPILYFGYELLKKT